MKAVLKRFGMLMLLVSCAAAQNRIAAVRDVTAAKEGAGVRVEVTMTSAVGASVKSCNSSRPAGARISRRHVREKGGKCEP